MKEHDRVLTFVVSLTVPAVATVYQVRDYIATAVARWGGEYDPSDPLFSNRIKNVKVKREGDKGLREPMGGEAIDLTDLISRLQVVECQIRQAGGIPAGQPIKVPVKVSEGFGPRRFDVAHVSAKPGMGVLLHFDRDD